ncbi:MAG TPA: site-2 protease family protein [Allosphingosinicella sp.]|nr:site-2 protease family protein [Allosphingosinicella sp.]
MSPDNIVFQVATWLIPLVVAIVLHEISHGWVANAFGDPTAREQGRLSLNPIRHVDPVGTVILPLILAVSGAPVFGWAKPVPVVAQRMRNPRWHMMLVALAGPGMNLLLALLAGIVFALVRPEEPTVEPGLLFLLLNLRNFIVINLFLAVFNLLPIPPFDGGHVVEGLLPRRLARHWVKLGRFGFLLLVFLLLILPMLAPQANIVERVVGPPVGWLVRLFLGG